jgi:hypothetical protein
MSPGPQTRERQKKKNKKQKTKNKTKTKTESFHLSASNDINYIFILQIFQNADVSISINS